MAKEKVLDAFIRNIKRHVNDRNARYVSQFTDDIYKKFGMTPQELDKAFDEMYSNLNSPRIRTRADDLLPIMDSGVYYSAKKTKHTSAPENHVDMRPGSKRRELSERMFGYGPRNSGSEIYGLVGPKAKGEESYGAYALNLKPSILERTTILPDDSYELMDPHPIFYGEKDPAFFIHMPKHGWSGFPKERISWGRRGLGNDGFYIEAQFHPGPKGIPLTEVESLTTPGAVKHLLPKKVKDSADKYGFSLVDEYGNCYYNCKD